MIILARFTLLGFILQLCSSKWHSIERLSLPKPVSFASCAHNSDDDNLFQLGGFGSNESFQDQSYMLNFSTASWEKSTNTSIPEATYLGAMYNNVYWGITDKFVYVFDLTTQEWSIYDISTNIFSIHNPNNTNYTYTSHPDNLHHHSSCISYDKRRNVFWVLFPLISIISDDDYNYDFNLFILNLTSYENDNFDQVWTSVNNNIDYYWDKNDEIGVFHFAGGCGYDNNSQTFTTFGGYEYNYSVSWNISDIEISVSQTSSIHQLSNSTYIGI